jgi:hypothetical protein
MQGFDSSARCSFGRFIRQEEQGMSRVRLWAEHVENWLATPGVLAVRYEDLLGDTRRSIAKMGDHLGSLPLGREPLLPARLASRRQGRIQRFFRRRPQSTAILGRPAAVSADTMLATNDLALFASEAGGTLARLGYPIWPASRNKAA